MDYIRGVGILYSLLVSCSTAFPQARITTKSWMTTWKPHGLRGCSGFWLLGMGHELYQRWRDIISCGIAFPQLYHKNLDGHMDSKITTKPGWPHGLRGRSGSCGWCWRMINAWKDRHQSAVRRRNRRLNNHMIDAMIRPICPENSMCSRKSKYILNNTSKNHNLNILRSYTANWTHFWHLHPSIRFFVQIAFSYLPIHSLYCVQKNWSPHLYFFFLAPFFSFFSFFLFVGTFFFFLPTDFRLPFNLAWNIKLESSRIKYS